MRACALWSLLLATACGGRHVAEPAPAPAFRFEVIGGASPSDTVGPTLRIEGQMVTIRGIAIKMEDVGLYGDLDLSQPHTLRLTVYDSLSGRPVDDPLPPPPRSRLRQVVFEARIGPLAPGPYEVWLGRYDARAHVVEVSHAPLHIDVVAPDRRHHPAPADSAGGYR
jgi:hypothetical protein